MFSVARAGPPARCTSHFLEIASFIARRTASLVERRDMRIHEEIVEVRRCGDPQAVPVALLDGRPPRCSGWASNSSSRPCRSTPREGPRRPTARCPTSRGRDYRPGRCHQNATPGSADSAPRRSASAADSSRSDRDRSPEWMECRVGTRCGRWHRRGELRSEDVLEIGLGRDEVDDDRPLPFLVADSADSALPGLREALGAGDVGEERSARRSRRSSRSIVRLKSLASTGAPFE